MNATADPMPATHATQLLRFLISFAIACALVLTVSLFAGATSLFTVVVSLLFVVLWLAFAYSLVFERELLDMSWQLICQQHLLVQAVIWLLFLPVVAGLWTWHRRWSPVLRLLFISSIAGVNLLLFFGGN